MSNENSSKSKTDIIENKLNFLGKHPIVPLSIIICIALILRFHYLPFGIPLTLDGLLYFWYANDVSILGHLPTGYTVATGNTVSNNGWPVFLAFFFSVLHSGNFMDYMFVQRLITIVISALTTIPVFLLCRKFVGNYYSIFGAAIFAWEPRVIQNSVFGLTDPLYIFLIAIALSSFLSDNRKMTYASFGIMALASMVRSEGLFLFLALSIMFFVRNGKKRSTIRRYAIALTIFALVLLPMVELRIQTTGNDELSGRIPSEVNRALSFSSDNGKSSLVLFIAKAFENFFRFLGWSTIPIFIFFIPIGVVLVLKNRDHKNLTVIVTTILMSLPILYALSTASDVRYFLPLYPLFCVLSVLAIQKYNKKFRNRYIFPILLIGGILLSSVFFLDSKKIDVEHEKEAWSLAYQVANRTSVINQYYPESGYLVITSMTKLPHFPILHSDFVGEPVKQINMQASSLEDYLRLGKSMGLTDLVLDGTDNFQNRPVFFKDVFLHEENYPYLVKIYDSWDHGYKYHLKIFKIDYAKFDATAAKNN